MNHSTMESGPVIPINAPRFCRQNGRMFTRSDHRIFLERTPTRDRHPPPAYRPLENQETLNDNSPQMRLNNTEFLSSRSLVTEMSTANVKSPRNKIKQRSVEDILNSILNPGSKSTIPNTSSLPKCPICLCQCQRIIIISSCLHTFCRDCILRWRCQSRKTTCPLCLQTWDLVVTDIYSVNEYRVLPFWKLLKEAVQWRTCRNHHKNRASIYTLNGERTPIPPGAQQRSPEWFLTNELVVKRWLRREIGAITDLDTLNAKPIVWQVLRLLKYIPMKISENIWNPVLMSKIWDLIFFSTEIFLHELFVFTNVSPPSLAEFDTWVAKSRTIDLTQSSPVPMFSMPLIDTDIDLTLPSAGEEDCASDVSLYEIINLT